jgi:hypothetical protein
VPYDGGHASVIEISGDEDSRVGVREIVALDQLNGSAANSALRIDLVDGKLGGPFHGRADRIGEGSCQADQDGSVAAAAACRSQQGQDERPRASRCPRES